MSKILFTLKKAQEVLKTDQKTLDALEILADHSDILEYENIPEEVSDALVVLENEIDEDKRTLGNVSKREK
jgi:hypothetical protein